MSTTHAPTQVHQSDPHAHLDERAIERFVGEIWDREIVDQLVEYVWIPN